MTEDGPQREAGPELDDELNRLRAEAYGPGSDDAQRAAAEARLARLQAEELAASQKERPAGLQNDQPAEQPAVMPTAHPVEDAEETAPVRQRRSRAPLIAGGALVAVAAVAAVLNLVLSPTRAAPVQHTPALAAATTAAADPALSSVTPSDDAQPGAPEYLTTGSPMVVASPAIARFFSHPVTPPAAVERTWGISAAQEYSGYDSGNRIVAVRFQSLGTASGLPFWGVFAMDAAGGGVICLVNNELGDEESGCVSLSDFIAAGETCFTQESGPWAPVTWKADGGFGPMPLPGVSAAVASVPAFRVINDAAPDLYDSTGALTAVGARLQRALNSSAPEFGEVRSATGKVFGLVTGIDLKTVCVSALDSTEPTCGDSASIAANGLLVATPEGRFRWSPNGTIAPVSK